MVLRDQTPKFVIMIGRQELLSVKHPTRKAGPYQSCGSAARVGILSESRSGTDFAAEFYDVKLCSSTSA